MRRVRTLREGVNKMPFAWSQELEERIKMQKQEDDRVVALSEKIVVLIASEAVTVEMAERALCSATKKVRARTIVSFTCP